MIRIDFGVQVDTGLSCHADFHFLLHYVWCGGAMVRPRTLDREVTGSIPGRGVAV